MRVPLIDLHISRTNEVSYLEQQKSDHRALALLRFLDREPGYTSNEHIISCLFDKIGLMCSRQQIRDLIERIEKIGLIRTSRTGDLVVVSLVASGDEVAKGVTTVEGVLRPGVDCPY